MICLVNHQMLELCFVTLTSVPSRTVILDGYAEPRLRSVLSSAIAASEYLRALCYESKPCTATCQLNITDPLHWHRANIDRHSVNSESHPSRIPCFGLRKAGCRHIPWCCFRELLPALRSCGRSSFSRCCPGWRCVVL